MQESSGKGGIQVRVQLTHYTSFKLPYTRICGNILLSPTASTTMQARDYRFGPYELRSRARELCKHGVKVKLRPQPFQVLKALVERAGDVLTRDELRELLWPKETFVDFEHGLNAAISELRGVLNDAASDPRYIETLPKVGYRIKVPVELITTDEPSGAPQEPRQQYRPYPLLIPPRRYPST